MAKKKQSPEISIVSVTHNSLKVLPRMLSSINSDLPIIIIDNNSDNQDGLKRVTKRHNARLILNQSNLGFGVSCNIGASISKTKYILFLNPDTELNENTIKYLLDAIKKYPNASAMNPKIIADDNKQFIKRRSHLLPRSKWERRSYFKKDAEVNILSGAALLVNAKHFNQVKGFDQNIFLFHEDDDLCLRLRKECGPLMYVNKSIVKHYSGTSTSRSNEIASFKAWHMGQSKIYTIKKHEVVLGRTLAIINSIFKIFSPENFFSRRRFIKNYSFTKSLIHACISTKH